MTNLPVQGEFQITAIFGQQGDCWNDGHKGLDFVAKNKIVYATCDGVVRVVNYDKGGWGRYVTIGDTNGNVHIFCHLENNSVKVKTGDKVNRTTIIGVMGTTGNSTGTHLHYQINRNSIPINPCEYLGVPNKKGSYNSKDFEIKENNDMTFKDDAQISNWAKTAVDRVTDLGLMSGVGDNKFDPKGTLTREQMAVVIDNLFQKGYVKI